MDPTTHSLAELGRALRAGELAPVELAQACLDRIEALDPRLNAFRMTDPERALAQARAAEAELRAGIDRGPLHGLPYAVKDLFDVRGWPTTAGLSLLENNRAKHDCRAVERLAAAGMVLLGKTNTVQFAYGGAGVNNDHGTPWNPWHASEHHLPGGSSSGSGVAVASRLVPMALGTDTGGSVRIPAALCGVTGLKTTVGRVSRAGVWPLSFSLDSVGPLARSAEDAALVLQALQGPDPADASTLAHPPEDLLEDLESGVRGLRLGFPEGGFWDGVDPQIEAAVRATGEVFRELGAHVRELPFPEADEARALNPRGLVIAAEAYAANRRWLEQHFEELDPVVAYRMIKGREVSAPDYVETRLAWDQLRARTVRRLAEVDALLVPTTLDAARPLADAQGPPERYAEVNLRYLRNTTIGNLLDLCGISVPCGFTAAGLPVGLNVYARPFAEARVLRIGHAFQQATDWHRREPDLEQAPSR